jgi:nucleoside-diphosphate-sugar epimerase
MQKSILVLGATGAMGTYLVPKLAERGYKVDGVTLDNEISDNPNITYLKTNAKDVSVLKELVANKYDAIVDLLIYPGNEFVERIDILLGKTDHYIYFSSYRVYADGYLPVTERCPQYLDISKDKEFLATVNEQYTLYKSLGEKALRRSSYGNWTIVRPAITYSKRRFQLVTLEANIVVDRAKKGLPIVLPDSALEVEATMSWGGDVAEMLARIVLNPKAYKEDYTLSTAEHHKWKEVAAIYKEVIGLEYVVSDTESYLRILKGYGDDAAYKDAKYQLMYDRCVNRIMDNSKILELTGLKQTDLTSLKDGLTRELTSLPADYKWRGSEVNTRMDDYITNWRNK